MAVAAPEILKFYWLRGPQVLDAKFHQIHQSVAELLRFFDFRRWQSSAILDLFGAYLDHSRRVIVGLYHLQNLVTIDAIFSKI